MWAEVQHSGWPGYVFRLAFTEGELQGIEVRRDGDDAAPLTAHLLQRVNLGALERAVRQQVNLLQDMVESAVGVFDDKVIPAVKPGASAPVAKWLDDARERKLSRERTLAKLARRYVQTLGEKGQTAILAEEFHYKCSSVAAMIREARNTHKLLTPTTKGRPGGSLTPKALALLNETEE